MQQDGVQLEQAGCDRQVGRLMLALTCSGSFSCRVSITRSVWLDSQTGSSLRIRGVRALIRRISVSRQEAAAYGCYFQVFLATWQMEQNHFHLITASTTNKTSFFSQKFGPWLCQRERGAISPNSCEAVLKADTVGLDGDCERWWFGCLDFT